ncbi:hypothetical protein AB1Y20_014860 [Prymnesium parvum]|uniref:Kinesin-like protein n=1 Tax=Prymnesium parvum TaxID=97485 RepID=A0AB34JYE6_PRYPA
MPSRASRLRAVSLGSAPVPELKQIQTPAATATTVKHISCDTSMSLRKTLDFHGDSEGSTCATPLRDRASTISVMPRSPSFVDMPTNDPSSPGAGEKETGIVVCVRIKSFHPSFVVGEELTKRGVFPERTQNSAGGMDAVSLQGQSGKYRFHAVYERETNEALFQKLGVPLVHSVLSGYNGTLMAYGQTGTGKTYTLGEHGLDSGPHAGLLPRMVGRLMSSVGSDGSCEVRLQYVQIYMEQLYDVLSSESSALQLREDPTGGAYVPTALNPIVRSEEEALQLIEQGYKQLIFGSTKMNRHSSRSHAICMLTVTRRHAKGPPSSMSRGGSRLSSPDMGAAPSLDQLMHETSPSDKQSDAATAAHDDFEADEAYAAFLDVPNDDPAELTRRSVDTLARTLENAATTHIMTTARLTICDLAGSERVGRAGACGVALKEGEKINTSLLALGNVIHALTRKSSRASHVPFRDSTLTRLLQNSLGGNCRTSMIVCVSPLAADVVETRSSLLFGERAMLVRSHLVQNASVDFKTLAEQLQAQLALAEAKLADSYKRAEMRGARAIQALVKMSGARRAALASRTESQALALELCALEGSDSSAIGASLRWAGMPPCVRVEAAAEERRAAVAQGEKAEEERRGAGRGGTSWLEAVGHSLQALLGCAPAA